MDKYGVTEHGFRRKLFSEILQDKRAKAREVFGENIDLSNTSFLGLLLENQSYTEAEFWEQMEDVYFSAFVDYSTGLSLDGGGKYITITRRPAVKSKGFITITGDDGKLIRKGFRVASRDVIFETTEDATIVDGSVDIPVKSIVAGKETNVVAGSIDKIVNPQAGIESVTNSNDTEGGLDIETDSEFRERYQLSTSRGGGSTVDAIRAALLDMDEVVDAFVIENTSMEIVNGIPPKSVASYVFGAEDEDVAETILRYKAGGIRAFGYTVLTLEDSQGENHDIGFTRPNVIDIYVKLNIKNGPGFKSDEVIKRAVYNYIGGIDNDGIQYKGLKLGEDVVVSRIIGAVACLGGIADIEVEISADGTDYNNNNIAISTNEIARIKEVVVSHDL